MANPLQKFFLRLGGSEKKDDPAYQMYAQFIAPGQPIYTPRDFKNLATFGYEKNITTYKAISLIAQSCAGIPWKLTQKTNKKRVIEEHPLLDLFMQPNPRHGSATFLEEIISYWILSGNAYMYAVRPNPRALPMELWTMRPDRMRVIPGIGTIAGYEYTLDGHRQYYDAPDIMHLKMFSATNDWYGLSPVAVAAALIDQQNEGFDWNTAILQNAGRPSGALVASGTLGNDQFERLRRVIREKYTGKKNAGVPLLLEGGLDWKQFSMSPMELDWQESRKQNMRDISIALGVPSELLGDNANKTYCLPYESRIETVHGPLPIGMLTPGIQVYSYDPTFNTIVKRRITRQWKTGKKKTFRLTAGSFTVEATANHPFLMARRNKQKKERFDGLYFVRLDDLRVGDLLVARDGPLKETIRHECVYSDEFPSIPVGTTLVELQKIEELLEVDVYDIEVEGTHTFFAQGLCVHNSNYGEARKSFYQETVLPLMDKLRDRLNVWLVPMFDERLELDYDKDQVEALQEDRDSLNTRVMAQWGAGVVTLNEVRNLLGLTEIDGGDYFNITTMNKAFVPEEAMGQFVETMFKQTLAGPPQPGAGGPPPPDDGSGQLPPGQQPAQLPPGKQPAPPSPGPNPSASPTPKPGQGSTQQGTSNVQDADAQETMSRVIVTEIKSTPVLESQQNLESTRGVEPVRHALNVTAQQAIATARVGTDPNTITDNLEPVWDTSKKVILHGLSLCSEQAGTQGVNDTHKNLTSAAYKKKWSPPSWQSLAAEYGRKHGEQATAQVLDTLKKEVAREIETGLAQGEDNRAIGERLSNFLSGERLGKKAEMIAQTEWTTAYNYGAHKTAGAVGIPLLKVWISTHDAHTRLAHAQADQQLRRYEDPFLVGGEYLMYPGDMTIGASAGNIIRCRCSQVFVPEKKEAIHRVEALLERTEKELAVREEKKRRPPVSVSTQYREFQESVRK